MNEEKLYNIYWHDGVMKTYVATTNNLDKWLEYNNKDREVSESLNDFIIEEGMNFKFNEDEI
jgi:hypothetical protein|tara:strand:- start:649 stop:834 length:186 start_codon:yes stop_codon:yes gene_type:complete